MKNAVLTGGGTGGHLFAAIAFAEFLKKQGYNPVIIGSEYGIEKRILPKYDFGYFLLKSKGIMGKDVKEKVIGAYLVTETFFRSISILKKIKPAFSVGFGGYVSLPVMIASKTLGIKTAILEQNSVPGKANKLLSRICDLTFVNFDITKKHLKGAIVVGNPSRIKMKDFKRIIKRSPIVGVIGGSRGARSINNAMMELSRYSIDLHFIHQTGDEDYKTVKETYKKNGKEWEVFKFIFNMEEFYKKIDFIICRAGASSLSEIACAGLASILIPYPHAIYNHQYFNAKYFADKNAAYLIEDKNLTGKKLLSIISSLTTDRIKEMSENASRMCRNDSCEKMLDALLTVNK